MRPKPLSFRGRLNRRGRKAVKVARAELRADLVSRLLFDVERRVWELLTPSAADGTAQAIAEYEREMRAIVRGQAMEVTHG